jgi:hypothetical protein
MFMPPKPPKVRVYFGPTRDVARLHEGQTFVTRMEEEIDAHQGAIQAENLLLNTVAKFQQLARNRNIPREELNALLRSSRYRLDVAKDLLAQRYQIPEADFNQPLDFEPIDTADYMRVRATMMGAVLSSTPVLLRDPWGGRPVTTQYGFSDFKASVDGISFSAIATPRYKGIPFRFAVMKHVHDGFTDNNPAFIMSDEFCDAFETYRTHQDAHISAEDHPLIKALSSNLKPHIHDRFHNWLLYDLEAASDAFKQWGNDIYLVDHVDKNPLLINYEFVAMSFHLYVYQVLFERNPTLKDVMYDDLRTCIAEIEKFGAFLVSQSHPKADLIQESTIYAVLSCICFVLNPFEDPFQRLLEPYPDVKQKMLEVRQDGKGIGAILQRLHGYEDGVPSQRYGGASEAVIEYVLRYPLAAELRARLDRERNRGGRDEWEAMDGKHAYTLTLETHQTLPPALREQLGTLPDSRLLKQIADALEALPSGMRQEVSQRVEVSEEGYVFFRLDRSEIDYSRFELRSQVKRVLLIDIEPGRVITFSNQKKLTIEGRIKKQDFQLVGGRDVLAINVRDEAIAHEILAFSRTDHGVDAERAITKAQDIAAMTGEKSASDMYKIERTVAESLYSYSEPGFYEAELEKHVARSAGPVIMQLYSGGDQRLIKGAFVYLPLGKNPATDASPDCHLIENTDYKRDYASPLGTDALQPMRLKETSPLMTSCPQAQDVLDDFLRTLHRINFQITHGASAAAKLDGSALGLFS